MTPFIDRENVSFWDWMKISTEEDSLIPKEYLQVDYIGSTYRSGMAYIALDWIPAGVCGFKIKCYQNGRAIFMGSLGGNPESSIADKYLQFASVYSNYQNRYRFYLNKSSIYQSRLVCSYDPHIWELKTNGEFYEDNNLVNTFPNIEQTNNTNMYLFVANNGSGGPTDWTSFNSNEVSIYEFIGYQIIDGIDKEMIHLYPVERKNDNKRGFFDVVNKVFYTSANTDLDFDVIGYIQEG